MSPTQAFLIGLGTPALTALAAWFGHLWMRRSSRESNTTADWAAFVEANNRQMDALRRDVDRLSTRVDDLDKKLRAEQRISRAAVGFIRVLLRWIEEHLPGQTPPQVPEILKEEL